MLQHLDLGHDRALPVWNDSRDSILEALRLGYQLLVHVLTTDMTQHAEYLLHDLLLRFYPQHCVYAGTPSSGAALLLTAGRAASIDISTPPGPQQQTRSISVWRPDGTDERTPDSCRDPAPHTLLAV